MAEVTWNLGGLGPEVQETAREAARRSGLTVAEWLQTVIIESAADEGVTTPHPAAPFMQDGPGSPGSNLESLQERLEQLARQLGRLTRGEDQASAPLTDSSSAEQSEFITALRSLETRLQVITQETIAQGDAPAHELSQALSRINKRLDFLANEGRVTSSELERRIAAVDRVLQTLNGPDAISEDGLREQLAEAVPENELPGQPSEEPAAEPPVVQPEIPAKSASRSALDDAIAQIEARQRTLDGPAAVAREPVFARQVAGPPAVAEKSSSIADDRLSGLEQRLQRLSQQLDALHTPNRFEEAVNALRADLSDISQKITDAAPRRAMEAIETEVRTLGQRIDVGRDFGADSEALAGIERGLQQVRDVLHTLAPAESLANVRNEVRALHSMIESVAASGSDNATLRQIQASVADLRAIAARAASGEALIVLAEEVQILGDKVDRFIGPSVNSKDALANLDRRFGEFADAVQTQRDDSASLASSNVVSVIESLSRKLDKTEAARDNTASFEQIGRQLAHLNEKLEAADARLGNLGAIESGLSELFQHFDTFRDTAITAARAAHEVASARGQVREGDVDTLKQDLDTLRQSQQTTERKTQDTLEAVHGTLERMVDRLALIEKERPDDSGMRSPQGDTAYSAEALTRGPLSALQAPPTVPRDESTSFNRRAGDNTSGIVTMPPMAAAMAERRPIDPSLPADTPLEPGIGAARARSPASPAERIAVSEAVLGEANPGGEPDSKANFIAAARRAAQAAANMSTPPAEEPPALKTGSSSRFGAIAQKFTGKRFLMAGVGLLIAGGGAHVLVNVHPAADIWRSVSTRMTALQAHLLLDEVKKQEVAAIPAVPNLPPKSAQPAQAIGASQPVKPVAAPLAPDRTIAAAKAPAETEGTGAYDPTTTATVSPLTIASIKLPSEVTGSVGKTKTFNQLPVNLPAVETDANPQQLPASFSPTLKAAAIAGNPAADYEIGMRYAEGRGVPLNLEEAARWLERAANRDIVPAQYRLGSLYEKGQGVKKNLEKARGLYRSAADRGNAKAMHNLAVLHAEGVDGKPDFKSASQWFRRGAESGVSDSQYNLGIMFARGLGLEQNLSESYKWFSLAAAQGDADAAKKRDDVAGRLDQQALEIAKLAVRSFTPEPQPEEAVSVKAPPEGWDKAAVASKGKTKPPARRGGGA